MQTDLYRAEGNPEARGDGLVGRVCPVAEEDCLFLFARQAAKPVQDV